MDVSSAFEGLEGVTGVSIEKCDDTGGQKVTVTTDGSDEITAVEAVAAIEGTGKASRYVLVTWSKG